MNLRKLILFGMLLAPGALFASPATLTLSAPAQVVAGQVFTSTVTVSVGSDILGGADFVVTFDTTALQFNSVATLAPQFLGGLYVNTSAVAQGSLHLLVLNDSSTVAPSGLVSLASMTFTAIGSGGNTTTLGAAANVIIDTIPVAYSPITVISATVTIQASSDHLPPRTTLLIGTPSLGSSSGTIISSQTAINLPAVDDKSIVGDGLGVGVKDTQYSIDGSSFTIYSGSFTLVTEGTHTLTYFSEDWVGNVEVQSSSSVLVDVTPPITQPSFTGLVYVDTATNTYLAPTTVVNLNAQDPVSNGVSAGVAFTKYHIDGAQFQRYTSPFTLSEGSHTLDMQSEDQVGNLESDKTLLLHVDATPPVSGLSAQPSVMISSGLVISSMSAVVVISTDPVSNGVASGVQQSQFAVDAGAFSVQIASFSIVTEGPHSVRFFSQDNVGNTEVIESTAVIVDNTPPEIQAVFAPDAVVTSTGQVSIDTATKVTITGQDGVAGFAFAGYRIDTSTGAFQIFTSTFSLSVGVHTMQLEAQDLVGNSRISAPFTVHVGTSPPTGTGITDGEDGTGVGIIGSENQETIVGQGSTTINPSVLAVALTPPSPVGKGTVNFAITFSEAMDTSVMPAVAFTLPQSTVAVTVNQASYSGNTWAGTAIITSAMPSGTAALSIIGAVDPQAKQIPNSLYLFDINLIAPPPPINTAISLNTTDQLVIVWENGLGNLPASYNLYRSTSPINSLNGLTPLQAGLTSRSAIDTPPANSAVIYYAVTAVDSSNNESGPSPTVSFALPYAPVISTPTNNATFTTSLSGYTLNIQGRAEPGVTVQVAVNSLNNIVASTTSANNGAYSVPVGLLTGSFVIYVSAQSPVTLLVSSAALVNVTITPLPQAPSGLAATPNDTVVVLSWNMSTAQNIVGYRIYRDGNPASLNVNLIQVNQVNYQDQGLTNGHTYSYTITAVDTQSNESLPSAAVPGTPVAGQGWGN